MLTKACQRHLDTIMKSLNKTLIRKATVTSAISALLLGSALSSVAQADNYRRSHSSHFTEYARVINARPVYKRVRIHEPRRECWIEYERYVSGYERVPVGRGYESARNNNHSGGAIVGGIIGGVIGNKLAHGSRKSSRAGATIAGAIIGSAIGNETNGSLRHNRRYQGNRGHQRYESRPIYQTRPVERCKRVSQTRYEKRLQHYNVTYRHRGRIITRQMPRDPGRRIRVQVSGGSSRY